MRKEVEEFIEAGADLVFEAWKHRDETRASALAKFTAALRADGGRLIKYGGVENYVPFKSPPDSK
jgi:hypothetical protein